MISRPHRALFVHVPKTGGQSVEMAFLNVLGLDWKQRDQLLLKPNPDPRRGPRRLAHLYASEYVPFGHASADEFTSFFKFAAVRNPWARAVSVYKFGYQPAGMTFATFLDDVLARGKNVREPRQIDPQTRYLHDAEGNLLVDALLRTEWLVEDFRGVSQRVFGREVPLPTRNVSPDRTGYRAFYNDARRQQLAELYRDDIEAFGYRFDDG